MNKERERKREANLPVSSRGKVEEDVAEKEVASLPIGLVIVVRALASTSSGTRRTSLRDSSTSSPAVTSRITSRNNYRKKEAQRAALVW